MSGSRGGGGGKAAYGVRTRLSLSVIWRPSARQHPGYLQLLRHPGTESESLDWNGMM